MRRYLNTSQISWSRRIHTLLSPCVKLADAECEWCRQSACCVTQTTTGAIWQPQNRRPRWLGKLDRTWVAWHATNDVQISMLEVWHVLKYILFCTPCPQTLNNIQSTCFFRSCNNGNIPSFFKIYDGLNDLAELYGRCTLPCKNSFSTFELGW